MVVGSSHSVQPIPDCESAEPTSQTGGCCDDASTSALVSRIATAPSTSYAQSKMRNGSLTHRPAR